MARPKTLKDGKQLVVRVAAEQKDKLACLADRLDTDPSTLAREALDALFDANPVPPEELAAFRKKQNRRAKAEGVPGLKRPKGAVARLVAVATTSDRTDEVEKKGIEPSTWPLIAVGRFGCPSKPFAARKTTTASAAQVIPLPKARRRSAPKRRAA